MKKRTKKEKKAPKSAKPRKAPRVKKQEVEEVQQEPEVTITEPITGVELSEPAQDTEMSLPPQADTVPAGKIELQRNQLESALKIAADVVTKSTLPILSNVYFVVKGGKCELRATDLETWYITDLTVADDTPELSKCVSVNLLLKEVRALPKETETIVLDFKADNVVELNDRCRLYTVEGSEFPERPDTPKLTEHVVIENFTENLKKVEKAIGTADARHVLNGAHLDFEIGRIVGTDGHRLHVADGTKADTGNIILPGKAVRLAIKHEVADAFIVDSSLVEFAVKPGRLFVKPIEGTFPNVQMIIDSIERHKKDGYSIVFQAKEFLSVLEGALPVANDNRAVRIKIGSDMVVNTSDPNRGDYEWKIECHTDPKRLDGELIGFNAQYLLDALRSYPEDVVTMEYNEPLAPIRFNSRAVVMPMRV